MLVNIALLLTLATYSTSSPAGGLNLNRYRRALNMCLHFIHRFRAIFAISGNFFRRQKYLFSKKIINRPGISCMSSKMCHKTLTKKLKYGLSFQDQV